MLHVHQVNLQPVAGGGEVYTRWFTRALADAGARVTLYVNPGNRFWHGLASDAIEVVGARGARDIARRLPSRPALIITQSSIPDALIELGVRDHVLTGFAHLPVLGRSAQGFARYAAVFTVTNYCVGLLRNAGIAQVYAEPMYGTFALERPAAGEIVARSHYQWDPRKLRDRVLALLEPLAEGVRARPVFRRAAGLTLGIVSFLTPIKQFPLLFTHLAPVIARSPAVRLEIFGSGGYAQVRDLKRALAPIGKQTRFWGEQPCVQAVYPQLDYLLTGLPEKEALGLNVLEAQACGTPVLAPNAPPFTETILDRRSGFLYRDPREDAGREFGEILTAILAGRPRPDPRAAHEHMEKFSYPALVGRTRRLLAALQDQFPALRDMNEPT